MRLGKGDLTIAWDDPHDTEMIEHIQALMDKGVTFHRIDTVEKGKIRKKLAGQPEKLKERAKRGQKGERNA